MATLYSFSDEFDAVATWGAPPDARGRVTLPERSICPTCPTCGKRAARVERRTEGAARIADHLCPSGHAWTTSESMP